MTASPPAPLTEEQLAEARSLLEAAIAESRQFEPMQGYLVDEIPRQLAAVSAELARRGITRDSILSVSLMCGAIAGWIDDILARLIIDHESPIAALDLAEQRQLDRPGAWLRVEVSWPEARGHEHTWLPWRSGDDHRAMQTAVEIFGSIAALPASIRRCTCGVFEHEAPCSEILCDREAGHAPPHRRVRGRPLLYRCAPSMALDRLRALEHRFDDAGRETYRRLVLRSMEVDITDAAHWRDEDRRSDVFEFRFTTGERVRVDVSDSIHGERGET